ncbi:MAG: hypothetical protein ACKOX6_17420 [Bdellovibrio sp.]
MKLVKTILAVAVLASATVSVAAPKCPHQAKVSMRENTNPVRVAKATTTVESVKSSAKSGVR